MLETLERNVEDCGRCSFQEAALKDIDTVWVYQSQEEGLLQEKRTAEAKARYKEFHVAREEQTAGMLRLVMLLSAPYASR